MRILIIDDEVNIRRITAAALEGMGCETADAANGEEALAQLTAAHFDGAFLDLKLENEDGMELLPQLLKTNPKLGVVVFTAQATKEHARAARSAGAVDFISKPFTLERLRQAVGKLPADTGGRPPAGDGTAQ